MFRSASANGQAPTGMWSNMQDFKLLPWCIWGLYSSVTLCSSSWIAWPLKMGPQPVPKHW